MFAIPVKAHAKDVIFAIDTASSFAVYKKKDKVQFVWGLRIGLLSDLQAIWFNNASIPIPTEGVLELQIDSKTNNLWW